MTGVSKTKNPVFKAVCCFVFQFHLKRHEGLKVGTGDSINLHMQNFNYFRGGTGCIRPP